MELTAQADLGYLLWASATQASAMLTCPPALPSPLLWPQKEWLPTPSQTVPLPDTAVAQAPPPLAPVDWGQRADRSPRQPSLAQAHRAVQLEPRAPRPARALPIWVPRAWCVDLWFFSSPHSVCHVYSRDGEQAMAGGRCRPVPSLEAQGGPSAVSVVCDSGETPDVSTCSTKAPCRPARPSCPCC